MDKKVDFLICGTQKGGTTALDAYLRTHPELCMASCKEVHFFDRNEFFPASEASYDWYHANFSNADKKKIWGEATPIYMYWDPAPQRINEYNPKIKIIITLRNPVERAYSHWNMEFKRSWDHVSFSEALMTEKERIAQAFPEQHRVYSYTDRGFYVKQLERLFGYFGRKNVLVIKSESLKQHPRSCLNDVCGFLGVDDFGPIEPMTVNARNYPGAMAESDLRYLQSMFEREIKALERLLGWDCSDWLEARQVACA